MGLGAAHHNAVGTTLHDMQIHIGVGLLVGSLGAVPLGVGHGAVHRQIVLLYIHHKFAEILMIMGAVRLVGFVGGGKNSVKGIHTDAALEAGGGLLAQQALHLDLFDQVAGRLMDVGKAVDAFAGIGRDGGHQILILRHLGQVVGHPHRIKGGAQDGIIHGTVDFFAEHIDLHFHPADRLNILFAGHKCHDNSSFLK